MKASIYRILLVCGVLSALPLSAAAESRPIRAKVIYGLTEEVFIPDLNIRIPAKIDTGAESMSLSAINVERFERGPDDEWVRFDLAIDGFEDMTGIEMPLSRNVRIKRRAADVRDDDEKTWVSRPVVEMTICIGGREARLDVNLADRRNFSTPMLIGSEALAALDALVDAEVEFAMGLPRCAGAGKARDAHGAEAPEEEDAATETWTPMSPLEPGAEDVLAAAAEGSEGDATGPEPAGDDAGANTAADARGDDSASGPVTDGVAGEAGPAPDTAPPADRDDNDNDD